jgi:hypothetical protein
MVNLVDFNLGHIDPARLMLKIASSSSGIIIPITNDPCKE